MGFFRKKKKDTNSLLNEYIDRDFIKKVLDYNQDNIVDVNDIVSLSKNIENSFSKYSNLIQKQLDNVKKDNSKST